MAITKVAAVSATSGAGTSGTSVITIPTVQTGDVGLIVNAVNTGATALIAPASWTEFTPQVSPGSALRSGIYSKTLASTDSGNTVAIDNGGNSKWSACLLILRGVAGLGVVANSSDNSADTQIVYPGVTPDVNDVLLVAMGGLQIPASPTGHTPPSGWTEDAEVFTTQAADPQLGAFVATKQLTGQAGVAQAAANATGATAVRDVVFVLAVQPSVGDTTGPIISSIAHGTPGQTSATITWTTNEAATSNVGYSTTPGVFTTAAPGTPDTTADTSSHSVALTGLTAGTTYYYRVSSTDAAGNNTLGTPGSFTTASPANTAPTANAGADQTGVAPYATVTLNGSGSTDPESQALTYAWVQTAGSPTVTLSGSGATRTFTAPATPAGTTLTFGLTVTDTGSLSSTQDTMTVTVEAHNRFVVATNGTTRTGLRSSLVT